MTLDQIRSTAKVYADAREVLAERVRNLNDELEKAKRRLLPGIRSAVAVAKEQIASLYDAIDQSRDLFVKPRTCVMHGIKVGLQKHADTLSWDGDEALVKAIKKHLPEQAETLIKTVEKPVRDALATLPIAELRKLGVRITEGSDVVVIKSTDGDVDKLVTALLAEPLDDQESEARHAA